MKTEHFTSWGQMIQTLNSIESSYLKARIINLAFFIPLAIVKLRVTTLQLLAFDSTSA
jgi:hypothetical protein